MMHLQKAVRRAAHVAGLFGLVVFFACPAQAQYVPDPDDPLSREDLASTAQFLADISDRPRRVIYTPYPVSPLQGVVSNFVHVSTGTAVLARTDLVIDSPFPIVLRRAYHSARSSSADFGASGWRVTVAERISRLRNGDLEYTYGNGRILKLQRHGAFRAAIDSYSTDVLSVTVKSADLIEVVTRAGIVKRFQNSGVDYVLTSVADAYANELTLRYAMGRLERIEGPSNSWLALTRDKQGRIKLARDSHGRTVTYGYDPQGRLRTVTDAGGQVWEYEYDAARRLVATKTPNGKIDTAFEYGKSGLVSHSRANGTRAFFTYAGPRTTVKDGRGLTTVFRADPSGLTAEVVNAFGTSTTLELTREGLPSKLYRNGAESVSFTYPATGLHFPTSARIAGSPSYRIAYDDRGRVSSASTYSSRVFEVVEYGPGLIPQQLRYGDGTSEQALFDANGELARHVKRNGTELAFERAPGRMSIVDSANRRAELEFDAPGRLTFIATPYGHSLRFDYNEVGLREMTTTSYGAYVRYQYDASGSLFHSVSGYEATEAPAHTYVLGPDQRVDGISSSNGVAHQFVYDHRGLLTNLKKGSEDVVTFDYDALARLENTQYRGYPVQRYQYSQGEPDIVAQLSYRTVPVFNQQREASEFGSRFDVGFTRIRPAALGALTFNELTNEIAIAADPARWTPMSPINNSLRALQIDALLGDQKAGIQTFSSPANRFVVPREYWSVNCCICICPPGSPPGTECNPD